MRPIKRSIKKRQQYSELKLPKGKLNFSDDATQLNAPVFPKRDKSKKEYSFVVDWQMSDF